MSSSIALAILGCSIGSLLLTFFQGKRIMTTQAQLAALLTAIGDQLEKSSAELSAEIETLTNEIANAGITTPEVDASIARLQGLAQKLDDMNPDAATGGDGNGGTSGDIGASGSGDAGSTGSDAGGAAQTGDGSTTGTAAADGTQTP